MDEPTVRVNKFPPWSVKGKIERFSFTSYSLIKLFHLFSVNSCCYLQSMAMLVLLVRFYCNGEWNNWADCAFAAFPRILFFAAFLLLLSFWVDLCHQADHEDEEDDDPSFLEALLKKSLNRPSSSSADSHRICFPFRSVHVGSRQKIVILVTVILVLLMMTFAMLIWVGMGSNSIDSSTIEQDICYAEK
ncbi:uncharacterized protein LOC110807589 isoform X1 [Carica papaya]|uniref:uncharacterized protein LOC110807589 isoform X1 n=1 Tax=Carica papaya TaxID=3649 RepID=UPI000B8CA34E|nr:uncharacterized protein LOC110807589 isoform X1 [Carica papaya]